MRPSPENSPQPSPFRPDVVKSRREPLAEISRPKASSGPTLVPAVRFARNGNSVSPRSGTCWSCESARTEPKAKEPSRSKAESVLMSIEPPMALPGMSGVTAFVTSTFETISAGNRSRAVAREPAVDASVLPLSVTLLRFAAPPRIETNRPSVRSLRSTMPGRRCTASAMFFSGRLPMRSAARASTMFSDCRFWLTDRNWLSRRP